PCFDRRCECDAGAGIERAAPGEDEGRAVGGCVVVAVQIDGVELPPLDAVTPLERNLPLEPERHPRLRPAADANGVRVDTRHQGEATKLVGNLCPDDGLCARAVLDSCRPRALRLNERGTGAVVGAV